MKLNYKPKAYVKEEENIEENINKAKKGLAIQSIVNGAMANKMPINPNAAPVQPPVQNTGFGRSV